MKKVLAIILSAALLITALAVNVVAASATGTATGTFSGTFTANDYDSGMSTVTGSDVDIDGTWGGQFPDITKIIEKVAPLEDVTHIKVTVTANDITPCWGGEGTSPRVELHWNNRAGTNAMTATFETTSGTAGQAVVYGDVPTGTTAVVLNPFAFNDEATDPIEFSVTVEVTYEEKGKVRIGDRYFDTLVDAVDAAKDGDTIYLLDNLEGAGIGIFAADGDVKDFTIDFGGFTYTCVGHPVGSTGTQSQAFHLEKSADKTPKVKLQNGTLTATEDSGVKRLIQNYCDLTLTNMNLKGTEKTQYVLSNNFGNTVIDGNTSITATDDNVAFSVYYANGPYAGGVSVTVNTTGAITGDIELGTWNAAGRENPAPDINDYLEKANLTINNVKLEGKIINKVGGFDDYKPDNDGGTYEENKAEYNEKLQKAIDINGGTFAADSNVNDYLPEGEYETDEDGNIIVGEVQLPSVNKNNSDRITGCVYLNEDYHALIVNGRFIAQPHVDNGTGFCVACKGAINK